MSRKKSRRYKRKPKTIKSGERRWVLIIDSKEAAVNFYSILLSLQKSNGGGLINKEAVKSVETWMNVIKTQDPDVEKRANDPRGPFREREILPLNISLELDDKHRALMHFLWKTMYNQLITPEGRESWIRNQGQQDYEFAVKNYQAWVNSLEGEGDIQTAQI